NTREIQAVAARVSFKRLESPFQQLPADIGDFDLVICSNVIDQCKEPERLVEILKKSTRDGGVLALSCSYQWQEKYIGNAVEQILNIKDLFGTGWEVLGEANLPFQFRKYERYWMNFLSHVLILKKL
ncbi:MAG: methyltransferase domain-containing protein, partial [Bdellovibrionales bacterium]